jgi:integrase
MTENHSTTRRRRRKARRPVRDLGPKPQKPIRSTIHHDLPFPLTVHPAGYFSKKIRGRVRYYGSWKDGPEAAERNYEARKADHEAGREAAIDKPHADGFTVMGLLNDYRAHKKRAMERGDITERTYADVVRDCDFLFANLDKNRLVEDLGPRDFSKLLDVLLQQKRTGKDKSLMVLGNHIGRIKSVFRYADKEGLIITPVRFGTDFSKPKAKGVERQKRDRIEAIRDEGAEPTFTAEEVRRMLGMPPWVPAAGDQLAAMILLGINCGLGNSDCAKLRLSHLDLERGWLDYPRPKTEKPRRAKLWPETVSAIKCWLAQRPEPTDPKNAKLVFLTKFGHAWDKSQASVSHEMRKLLDRLHINHSRSFYTLRATFRTEAGRAADAEASYYAMGHALPGMGQNYVKYVHDDRLEKVAAVVHDWFWPLAKD